MYADSKNASLLGNNERSHTRSTTHNKHTEIKYQLQGKTSNNNTNTGNIGTFVYYICSFCRNLLQNNPWKVNI